MAIADPSKTYTITDFIDMKPNDNFTYGNLALYMQSIVDKTIIYSSDNVFYTYLEEMKPYLVDYTFTDEEYRKYLYRPKLLSYDVYGSTELYFVILAVNDMCNIKDFRKKKIKMFYKSDLNDFLNRIMSTENNRLSINKKSINYETNNGV
ncbi:MAG: baseplate wedge protein 53 [Candidatus Izemoplasmatales bacterium]|nr:baseplate wedge protein 53 [Candidatus Izemoplasmatales bacterium]